MRIELTVLGSGTSVGVPMVGCRCATCTSPDPRDRRMRASVMLRWGEEEGKERILVIDTTPEFRLQMLRVAAPRLDAVLLTHHHADHIHGLDDIRPYCFLQNQAIPIYGPPATLTWVRQHYAYIWEAKQEGGGLPRVELFPVEREFSVGSVTITPIPVFHGIEPVYGYRIGDLAYLSDVSSIPESSLGMLRGIRILFLDAVRYTPHPTHFHLEAAVEMAKRLAPEQTFLTHLNHDFLHARLEQELPPGIAPAYDGLTVACFA